jgi:hypothetical protein
MTTPYYERFTRLDVQATCPGCDNTLPLRDFRKWWGKKRILRSLCIACEPEKSFEAMTPTERRQAVDNQRPYATPMRMHRQNAADIKAKVQRNLAKADKRVKSKRTQAWAPLMRELRQEKAWCARNLITPASPEWATFFEAYETALNDALRKVMKHKGQTSRIEPTPAEQEPMHWLYPETRLSLRRLYALCPVVRGRRLYRDPLCLSW